MSRKRVSIKLHRNQMRVFKSPCRFRTVVAGRRWGKTQLARSELIRAARKPKALVWYVAPTYTMAKDVMWNGLLETIPAAWIRRKHDTKMWVQLKNGTYIHCKGADNPDSLRGVGLDFVVLDEFQDIDPDAWKLVIRPTLMTTGGRALFIGTPKSFNLLWELWAKGQEQKNVDARRWESWQFKTIDSPFISQSEIDEARADMDEKSFRQELEASFETMSGRVYYTFDRKIHVKPCAFNPDLPIWVGQDFNKNPMSSTILQKQPNGELWAVDEIVLKGSSTQEVCEELERRYWRNQSQVVIYPDPAGAYTQHARGETDLDIFREKGFRKIKYRKKHPKVVDRINCVNRKLRAADGTVSFYIDPRCKALVTSLEQTIYKVGTNEVDKKMDVEHAADSLGYPVELEFPLRKLEMGGLSL